jgi:hypothetical protein
VRFIFKNIYKNFSAFLLPFFGFYSGLLLAFLLRQRIEDIVAIAIETGVQNMPIAIAVLKVSPLMRLWSLFLKGDVCKVLFGKKQKIYKIPPYFRSHSLRGQMMNVYCFPFLFVFLLHFP